MTLKYLLDTNIVSEPLRPTPNEKILKQLQLHQDRHLERRADHLAHRMVVPPRHHERPGHPPAGVVHLAQITGHAELGIQQRLQ